MSLVYVPLSLLAVLGGALPVLFAAFVLSGRRLRPRGPDAGLLLVAVGYFVALALRDEVPHSFTEASEGLASVTWITFLVTCLRVLAEQVRGGPSPAWLPALLGLVGAGGVVARVATLVLPELRLPI
ncbi:MAG: hypothetical protein U0230_15660 [Polyangiales bacterium]